MNAIKTLTLIVAAALTLLASVTATAAGFDGTRWNVGVTSTKDYDASCQICRAQNGRPSMSECGGPETMKPGLPYVIYCGGGVWGHAGTAPGTTMVGPGESVGAFRAGPNDYWTVKQ